MRLILQFGFLLLLFFMFACKKDALPTVIEGKVTDKKTGLPVANAFIDCSGYKGQNNNQIHKDYSTSSDFHGNYKVEIPNEYRVSFPVIYKPGYLPKVDPAGLLTIKIGEINTIDALLIPTDGFLRLNLKNDTGIHDSIYVTMFNKVLDMEGLGLTGPEQFPVILLPGDMYEELFALPIDEKVKIYWGFEKFTGLNAPFQDSISLTFQDTLNFTILY